MNSTVYKLARGSNCYTEWYTIRALLSMFFILISIFLILFFGSPSSRSFLFLYTFQLFTSWPFIFTYLGSHYDTCPFKLLLKVVEGAV